MFALVGEKKQLLNMSARKQSFYKRKSAWTDEENPDYTSFDP
jgi:hypothetical protein